MTMFMRPRDIWVTLECSGTRRTQLVLITRTKMRLLRVVSDKDALLEARISTQLTSITSRPTHTSRTRPAVRSRRFYISERRSQRFCLCTHLFTNFASRQVYPVFTESKLVSELTSKMSELLFAHSDWKPNGSVIDHKIKVDVEVGCQACSRRHQ